MIRVENVSKIYHKNGREIRALDGLSIVVERGQFLAVKGPSGSGKSTLLAMLGGMLAPTSGSVSVLGKDLYRELSGSQRAKFRSRQVGFVFQMFHLVPYLTVLENVLLPAPLQLHPPDRKRGLELLERFGLASRGGHRPEELSAGERQRTALARAMIAKPELILADEPTGNLDPENSASVMRHLAEYNSAGGTVVMVTHEDILLSHASRTVCIRDGKIEQCNRH